MIKLHHYGEGFPIVCLHGWGFDHTIWHCLFPLAHDWQLIMVDLPGHGQTKTMPMSIFTTELLKHLPHNFAVIGWSLGGLYAFHLSKQAGSRMKHLFAVSTSPCFMKQNGWPGIDSAVLTRFYRQYMRNPVVTVRDFIDLQFLKQPSRPNFDYCPILPTDAELGLTLLQSSDFRSDLKSCGQDISFLLGQQDAIVPASLASVLKSDLGINDVYVINHCGHMPFLSHGDIFIDNIKEKLK